MFYWDENAFDKFISPQGFTLLGSLNTNVCVFEAHLFL